MKENKIVGTAFSGRLIYVKGPNPFRCIYDPLGANADFMITGSKYRNDHYVLLSISRDGFARQIEIPDNIGSNIHIHDERLIAGSDKEYDLMLLAKHSIDQDKKLVRVRFDSTRYTLDVESHAHHTDDQYKGLIPKIAMLESRVTALEKMCHSLSLGKSDIDIEPDDSVINNFLKKIKAKKK